MTLPKIQVRWLVWQVVVPIAGPIAFSAVFIGFWMTGNPAFKPNMKIILDVSPWALTFYTLALVGSSLNGLWPKLSKHPALGVSLFLVSAAVAVYASFTVIWRHMGTFVAGAPVYYTTGSLLFLAVVLCHWSYTTQQSGDPA